jgi:hypothetical protein
VFGSLAFLKQNLCPWNQLRDAREGLEPTLLDACVTGPCHDWEENFVEEHKNTVLLILVNTKKSGSAFFTTTPCRSLRNVQPCL